MVKIENKACTIPSTMVFMDECETIANSFNDQFFNLQQQDIPVTECIIFVNCNYNNFIVSEGQVAIVIKSLSKNKAHGIDGISAFGLNFLYSA